MTTLPEGVSDGAVRCELPHVVNACTECGGPTVSTHTGTCSVCWRKTPHGNGQPENMTDVAERMVRERVEKATPCVRCHRYTAPTLPLDERDLIAWKRIAVCIECRDKSLISAPDKTIEDLARVAAESWLRKHRAGVPAMIKKGDVIIGTDPAKPGTERTVTRVVHGGDPVDCEFDDGPPYEPIPRSVLDEELRKNVEPWLTKELSEHARELKFFKRVEYHSIDLADKERGPSAVAQVRGVNEQRVEILLEDLLCEDV